ncbi:MAG TPA: hypothetical protein VFJ76_07845 [Solirubrobacterales bacterium]|nr:hypothetical protein [Solirubrobacterales bacterium]
MSTKTFSDPKVVQLGEKHGPVGLAWWTLLLCEAGAQEKGGTVEVSFRTFSFELHTDAETVGAVLETAERIGLCHKVSRDVHSFKTSIPAWKRWQAAGRKAEERNRRKQADVTDSHEPSRDVTTDRQRDKQRNSAQARADISPYDRKTKEVHV